MREAIESAAPRPHKVLLKVAVAARGACGFDISLMRDDRFDAVHGELRADLARSEARVARLADENERLRREITRLEQDPWARDRALREDLDLAAPGEVVVRFVSATDPRGRAAPRMPHPHDERGRATK